MHRLRALDLLGRFLDLGPWAVSLVRLCSGCSQKGRPSVGEGDVGGAREALGGRSGPAAAVSGFGFALLSHLLLGVTCAWKARQRVALQGAARAAPPHPATQHVSREPSSTSARGSGRPAEEGVAG